MSDETISHIQRVARIGSAGLLCIACLMALAVKARRAPQAQGQVPESAAIGYQQDGGVRSVGVKVRQLDPISGIVPVTLACEDAKVIGAGTITQLPCTLQNKSSAAMVAGTIHVLTTIKLNDKEDVLSSYETFDILLHPDFRDEKKNSFVRPGALFGMDVTPGEYLEASVKEIEIGIDYIEFVDGSLVGPNQAGSRIVGGIREGAAKYKTWLVKQYASHGRSMRAIEQLLENESSATASDVGVQNADQTSGANLYRKYVRRLRMLKGSDDFLKRLLANN